MVQLTYFTASRWAARSWLYLLRIVLVSIVATLATGCSSLPTNVVRPVSGALTAQDETALGRLVQQRRTQALATSADDVFGHPLDQRNVGIEALAKFAVDLGHVGCQDRIQEIGRHTKGRADG